MDKGTTAIQNVQLLKWGYESMVDIQYNLLVGLPGDTILEYSEMVRLMPRLYHLMPPTNFSQVIVTRFAPLHTTPWRFGYLGKVRHHPLYEVIFSESFIARTNFNLDNYCYNFEQYYENEPELLKIYDQLRLQTEFWKVSHLEREVVLSHRLLDGKVVIKDTRFGEQRDIVLGAIASDVYRFCLEQAMSLRKLEKRFPDSVALSAALGELDEQRVIWISDERVFSLGIDEAMVKKRIQLGFYSNWSSLAGEMTC